MTSATPPSEALVELLDTYEIAVRRGDRDRRLELRKRLLHLLLRTETATCKDCGSECPRGHGLGYSVSDEEWTDRSQPRPVKLTPLCPRCVVARLLGPDDDPRRP